MKGLIRNIVLILLIVSIKFGLIAQENANEGKKFLLTFPINDNNNRVDIELGIYVYSQYNTQVRFINHKNQRTYTHNLSANSFFQFDARLVGNYDELEDNSSEVISDKVIEVNSDEPISVSVINSKEHSSESYLVYPISEWGKNYIHNSFYHFYNNNVNRSSGFTILSSENNTNVRIVLKGRGGNRGATLKNKYKIGDTINVTINANESYSVRTNSDTSSTFDFSGSLITSNKEIGVVSFHQRTMLPQVSPGEGQDNLLEMQQPLSNWRNKFISVDLGRSYGDLFRVLPLKDNTKLKISNYDELGNLISTTTEIINTGGGFYEYNNQGINNYNRDRLTGIKGNTIWESDSPILVTQYSYSQDWDKTSWFDNSDRYDPFMMNLINEEQFTDKLSFLIPPYDDFDVHQMNMIIKVDTLRNIDDQLKSIVVNNQNLYIDYPNLFNNRIGNTDYYWLRFDKNNSDPNSYNITSDVRLAVFLYGFGEADSYGMQTALGNLPLVDTLIIGRNNFDCNNINLQYNIRSTFGANKEGEFEGTNFEIDSFSVTEVINATLDFSLTDDHLGLNFIGKKENLFEPAIVYLQVYSETGKIFYDTIRFEYFNNIAINANQRMSSFPGENITFDIYIDEVNDSLVFLKDYSFNCIFRSDIFEFVDLRIGDISVKEMVSMTMKNDTTYLKYDNMLERNQLTSGNKAELTLRTMLSLDSVKKPEFVLLSQFETACYKGTKIDTLDVKICGGDLRVVYIDPEKIVEFDDSVIKSNYTTTFTVYNVEGKTIIENYKLNKLEPVDLKNIKLSTGLYFIKIKNSDSPPLKYFHF